MWVPHFGCPVDPICDRPILSVTGVDMSYLVTAMDWSARYSVVNAVGSDCGKAMVEAGLSPNSVVTTHPLMG